LYWCLQSEFKITKPSSIKLFNVVYMVLRVPLIMMTIYFSLIKRMNVEIVVAVVYAIWVFYISFCLNELHK